MAISHMESDLPFWLQKGIKNERFYQNVFLDGKYEPGAF